MFQFKKKLEEFRKIYAKEMRELRTIHKGNLKLYLDDKNRVRLYYKENELTKQCGFGTGILSDAAWYYSGDAIFLTRKISSDEMQMVLNFPGLSMSQVWNIRITAEENIVWDVNIELKECLRLDMATVRIFLPKAYSHWVYPLKEGMFSPEFDSQWHILDSLKGNDSFIGCISLREEYPSIVFKDSEDTKALLLIQNTDLTVSSRVLEAQVEELKEYHQPGTYPCFRANIQFYPDKSVLEGLLAQIKQLQKKQEEELKKQQELENNRQEEERLKQEEAEKARIKLEEDMKIINLIVGRAKSYNAAYVFGDSESLHNKISVKPNDFIETISKIKNATKKNANIEIGISRFNFFRLNEIVQFCFMLRNQRLDLRSVIFDPLPVHRLYTNFIEYIKELRVRAAPFGIDFFLKDENLPELLSSVSMQADQYNEKDLLRLLGVITEHPFIGPQTIVLDTYHRCNTNCIHCWIHTPKRRLPFGSCELKMDTYLYKRIIDDAAALLCDEIIIQGDGEPTLDNRFMDMIRYARDKGLKVLFFTNAITLDKNKIRRIIKLEINEIFCSLPAGTAETYAIINSKQSKDTFNKIVENLKNLISMRNKLGKDKPCLQMTHVLHNLNYHELGQMSKVDTYIGADKVRFYLVRLDENIKSLKLKPRHITVIKNSLRRVQPYLKKKDIQLQDNIYFQLKNYNSLTGYWSKNTFLKSGCLVGWFFSLILAKGEISMCCHQRIVDYLKAKSFKEIWNSESYNRFRVQAKYLTKNKDAAFLNGVKLYDEFCHHCDTHQVILRINQLFGKYNLRRFL